MITRIAEVLKGQGGNYIFPFLWMKGEEEAVIRREIEKIAECGIGAVCLESRPHPDFLGERWWRDFDIVLEECKKRGMRIWILDDAHFPTGLANGLVKEKYPERARKYISVKTFDVDGPCVSATMDMASAMKKAFSWMDIGKPSEQPLIDEQKVLCVQAFPLLDGDTIGEEYLDLTEDIEGGTLRVNLPAGTWRILVVHTTYDEGAHPDYIHMIDPLSVSTLLEAVYEAHYARYAEEFGKTIAGFFSDEPGFYNVFGFEMDEIIGRKMMPLPYTEELGTGLEERFGEEWRKHLAYLWYPCAEEGVHAEIRHAYMDVVTRLYEKHFSRQVGDWCRAHGVEYVGHVIEDNNVNARLGCGAGHYFRAMSGQDMAGMDVIGDQVIPGRPDTLRHGFNTVDGKFMHYIEAKMAASCAHFQPEKKGRLMCEAFGAYGWGFGVRDMKWLADHLISRGVNHFVPHAFSMDKYPDTDCPPHFYAGGHNPEFPYFGHLMRYVNRLCHIFQNGKWRPQAGILYRAEQEWAGEAALEQVIAEKLYKAGIDYCLVPVDALADMERYNTSVENGILAVNGVPVPVLIVGDSSWVDARLVAFAGSHPECRIIRVGSRLRGIVGGIHGEMEGSLTEMGQVRCVMTSDELPEALAEEGIEGMKAPAGSFFRYETGEGDLWMIFNESLSEQLDGTYMLALPSKAARIWRYDAMKNRLLVPEQERAYGEGGCVAKVTLSLAPYESAVLFAAEGELQEAAAAGSGADGMPEERAGLGADGMPEESAGLGADGMPEERAGLVKTGMRKEEAASDGVCMDISGGWEIWIASSGDEPEFAPFASVEELQPVSDALPAFSGYMSYRKDVEIEDPTGTWTLEAEHLYEVGRVLVNGKECDVRLVPPYRFDLTGAFKEGTNHIEVEVANTPLRDVLNYDQAPLGHEKGVYEPSGMFGSVRLVRR